MSRAPDAGLSNNCVSLSLPPSLLVSYSQDILSVAGVDSRSAASVAPPQGSWEGVSLTFRRSPTADSGGGSPSPAPPTRPGAASSFLSEADPVSTPPAAQKPADNSAYGGRGKFYPSYAGGHAPGGVGCADGAGAAIPTVSEDQRPVRQRAVEDGFPAAATAVLARRGDGGGGEEEEEEEGLLPPWREERHRSLPFTCTLRAETNASIHHIPVFVFDGSLHFGLLGAEGAGEWEAGREWLGDGVGAGGRGDGDSARGGGGDGGQEAAWSAGLQASPADVAGLPPDSRYCTSYSTINVYVFVLF